MTSLASTNFPGRAQVQRQIQLPLGKAIEIAWNGIRMRLARSLIVTSGIVLALAFLSSVLVSELMTASMRRWAQAAPATPEFVQMGGRRLVLEAQAKLLEVQLAAAARDTAKANEDADTSAPPPAAAGELDAIQKRLGVRLPALPADLAAALARDPSLRTPLNQWTRSQQKIAALREALAGPQKLAARMQAAGVPTNPVEVRNRRVQTRWLSGLALLVAFVGILNAMLMSVTERFREIGTMKCLGALDSFIVRLFLIESAFQGLIGTLVGVATGVGLSLLMVLAHYGRLGFANFPTSDILTVVLVSSSAGVGITVAAAVYPAWRAARMAPIEAMRVEP